MDFNRLDFEDLLFLTSSISLASILFLPPPRSFLSPEGRDSIEINPFMVEYSTVSLLLQNVCLYLFSSVTVGSFSGDG